MNDTGVIKHNFNKGNELDGNMQALTEALSKISIRDSANPNSLYNTGGPVRSPIYNSASGLGTLSDGGQYSTFNRHITRRGAVFLNLCMPSLP